MPFFTIRYNRNFIYMKPRCIDLRNAIIQTSVYLLEPTNATRRPVRRLQSGQDWRAITISQFHFTISYTKPAQRSNPRAVAVAAQLQKLQAKRHFSLPSSPATTDVENQARCGRCGAAAAGVETCHKFSIHRLDSPLPPSSSSSSSPDSLLICAIIYLAFLERYFLWSFFVGLLVEMRRFLIHISVRDASILV